jgi:hypothetical protein
MKILWILAGILCVDIFIIALVISILVVNGQNLVYGGVANGIPLIPLIIVGLLSLAGTIFIFRKKIM